MKLYISSGICGATGVVSAAQCDPSYPEYSFGRSMMMHDLHAALRGAFEAGAELVVVNDAHGAMTNIDISGFGKGVRVISGNPKLLGMAEGSGECDGAVFLGYHAMAGTEKAVLDHTYDRHTIRALSLNGRKMGETGINALFAGVQGVPVIAVSGDDALCMEAASLLGGDIETMPVKEGLSHAAAVCLTPEETAEMISEGVRRAAEKLASGVFSPFAPEPPYIMEITLADTIQTDSASLVPGAVRTAPCTLRFEHDEALELRRVIYSVIKCASAYSGLL